MKIKNVVFDVGNVLVRWDPHAVVVAHFPENQDHEGLTQLIFKSSTWFDLNKGLISQTEAIAQYQRLLKIEESRLNTLMHAIKESLVPIEGSFALLKQLFSSQYPLYALTDNTHELMRYLKSKYDFWSMFRGVVVSADVGHLKPSSVIYRHLLDSYHLIPQETLFIDDFLANVDGAKAMQMQAIQFENVNQCLQALRQLGMSI